MGCDIHDYVEVKKDGKWVFDSEEPYGDRNYNVFSILADVRNGVGFAGCDTGDGFIPIFQPKGLPKDVSREVQLESDGWGSDGHSHSYLTLREILDYDWTRKTKLRGWVDASEYKDFKLKGQPDSWCGGASGFDVHNVSIAEMEKRIKNGTEKNCWCNVEWEVSYADCARDFLGRTVENLKKLGEPENVRIVFWFDN